MVVKMSKIRASMKGTHCRQTDVSYTYLHDSSLQFLFFNLYTAIVQSSKFSTVVLGASYSILLFEGEATEHAAAHALSDEPLCTVNNESERRRHLLSTAKAGSWQLKLDEVPTTDMSNFAAYSCNHATA